MTLRVAGLRNGFLLKSTGQVVAFVRKREEFRVNDIVKYVETPNVDGVYHKISRDEGVRTGADESYMNKTRWRDGANAPAPDAEVLFEDVAFHTERYTRRWQVGYQAIDNFEHFDLKRVHMDHAESQIMTDLTYRVVNLLTTTSNWGSAQQKTFKGLAGTSVFANKASADEANPGYLAIRKMLLNGSNIINLATNAKVKPKDLRWVMNVETAIKLGQTAEMADYIKGSPDAKKSMEDPENLNVQWGLPRAYFGYEIVVMNDVQVTNKRKTAGTEATTTRSTIWPDNKSVLLARPGTLDGTYGTKDYATMQVFWYGKPIKGNSEASGQAVVTAYPDDENQVLRGAVTMQYKEELAAPVAGLIIDNMFE